jgi:hypothetical protein
MVEQAPGKGQAFASGNSVGLARKEVHSARLGEHAARLCTRPHLPIVEALTITRASLRDVRTARKQTFDSIGAAPKQAFAHSEQLGAIEERSDDVARGVRAAHLETMRVRFETQPMTARARREQPARLRENVQLEVHDDASVGRTWGRQRCRQCVR